MPKAFTEEERTTIKEKLMETALDVFHEKGSKALNIAELTKRVGIAQGSFYNFWEDKEALVIELFSYRANQKLRNIEKKFKSSLANPAEFLTEIIYQSTIDFMIKVQNQPMYTDAFKIFETKGQHEARKIEILYQDFLAKLIGYWEQHGAVTRVDRQGLMSAFIGSSVLCSQYYQFDTAYFKEILRICISGIVNTYIEV